jgi:hypothetical protein
MGNCIPCLLHAQWSGTSPSGTLTHALYEVLIDVHHMGYPWSDGIEAVFHLQQKYLKMTLMQLLSN